MRVAAVILVIAAFRAATLQAQAPPPAPPWDSPLARQAPLAGRIHDTRSGLALTAEALIQRLAAADFVLLGERHDNPDHHRLQAWIAERLLDRGRPYGVAFEMIDSGQAPKLAQYLATSPRDSEGLGPALDWHNSGWPAWRHYRPIAAAALGRGLPILAANLPPDVARGIARNGLAALPAALAQHLRLDPADDSAVLDAHSAEIQRAHCGVLPERSLAFFALAQYARDAEMARVMSEHWRRSDGGQGVVLIAGAGHVRTDRGVPLHLGRMAPGARVASLAFIEADDTTGAAPDIAALPYDVVWLTARVDDTDRCAAPRVPRQP